MTDATTESTPDEAVARLLAMLDLEPLEVDLFRGTNPTMWPGARVFGGLVASQALRAGINSVDVDHHIHSLHGYFLRPGKPGDPIVYHIDRIRNGKSFTTRRVNAVQNGEAIFTMACSFHREGEEGDDYQLPRSADAPVPEELDDRDGGFPSRPSFFQPFEMREVGPTEPEPDGTYRSTRRVWVKTAAGLPDDPAVHACVLTFMSDMAVVLAVRPPTPGQPWAGFMGASLDHAVWFHRRIRADEWMLYDLHSLSFFNARGLARGAMHSLDGTLGVSVTQEALVRTLPEGTMPPGMTPPPEVGRT
ncbi:MAG: acyl-CoA thioesterase [Acidimicrobiales bacterium]